MSLPSATYTNIINLSTKSTSSTLGKLAHAHIIKTSFQPSMFLLNTLLSMYCKCGEMSFAYHLFDKMPQRNLVSFNTLISRFTQIGLHDKIMDVFAEARLSGLKLDKFTYAGALSVSGQTGDLKLGKLIHGLVIISGLGNQVFLTNSIIDMYSKCRRIDQARSVFDNCNELDQVSWNTLLTGYLRYARIGTNEQIWKLLGKMQMCGMRFTTYTMGTILKACCKDFDENCRGRGVMLHGFAVKLGMDFDIVVATALLDMYAKAGNLADAIKVFDTVPDKNIVMCNAMIAGFIRTESVTHETVNKAFRLFADMWKNKMKPSKYTFSSILKACNAIEGFEFGKQVHAQILKNKLHLDEFIGSALIDLYSSSSSIDDALKCFNSTSKTDVVSWTSMISGHVQNGEHGSAFALFRQLITSSERKPDEFVISTMLSACADLAIARSGEQIQGYAIKNGTANFPGVKTAQISMYARSGDLHSAKTTFEDVEYPDVITWSVMICGYAHHGYATHALTLFDSMRDSGVAPNAVSFLGVLTACSHGGLVEDGLRYFENMKKDYGSMVNKRHYACVVDLLGRSGRLADAERLITSSGFEGNPVIWRALLSGCRVHKDADLGKRAAERVIELEPDAAASYVLLYNIYSDAGVDGTATKVRDLMTDRKVRKRPGMSWIEVRNEVHSFVVGDKSHAMSEEIHYRLDQILVKIKKIGCGSSSIKDGSSRVVNHHSEKLAVSFGIISLSSRLAPVRVMKNLRVCDDCHETMKLISEVENREIIVRDPIRFHHFKEGSCSCGDYW